VRAPASLDCEVKRDPLAAGWGLGRFFMLWRGACELANEACDRARAHLLPCARASNRKVILVSDY
jgi:hypothetical protein